jgi:hypothetical protein
VAAAAAEIPVESLLDLVVRWFGISIQERFCHHDHPVHAVTALRRLLLDKRNLQRVGVLQRAQTFQRSDVAVLRRANGNLAGAQGVTIQDHSTGAALAQPTAESGPMQFGVVSQNVQEWGGWISFHNSRLVIYSKGDPRHNELPFSTRLPRESCHLAAVCCSERKRRFGASGPGLRLKN